LLVGHHPSAPDCIVSVVVGRLALDISRITVPRHRILDARQLVRQMRHPAGRGLSRNIFPIASTCRGIDILIAQLVHRHPRTVAVPVQRQDIAVGIVGVTLCIILQRAGIDRLEAAIGRPGVHARYPVQLVVLIIIQHRTCIPLSWTGPQLPDIDGHAADIAIIEVVFGRRQQRVALHIAGQQVDRDKVPIGPIIEIVQVQLVGIPFEQGWVRDPVAVELVGAPRRRDPGRIDRFQPALHGVGVVDTLQLQVANLHPRQWTMPVISVAGVILPFDGVGTGPNARNAVLRIIAVLMIKRVRRMWLIAHLVDFSAEVIRSVDAV